MLPGSAPPAQVALWLENELCGPDGAIRVTFPPGAYVSDIARAAAEVMAFGRAAKASEVQVCRHGSRKSVSNRDGATPLFQDGDTVWVQLRELGARDAAAAVPALSLRQARGASPGRSPRESAAPAAPVTPRGYPGRAGGKRVAGKSGGDGKAGEGPQPPRLGTPRLATPNYTPKPTAAALLRVEANRARREEAKAKDDPLKKRWGIVGAGDARPTFGAAPAPGARAKRGSPEPPADLAAPRVPVAVQDPLPAHEVTEEGSAAAGEPAGSPRSVRAIAAAYDASAAPACLEPAAQDGGDVLCDISPQSADDGQTIDFSNDSPSASLRGGSREAAAPAPVLTGSTLPLTPRSSARAVEVSPVAPSLPPANRAQSLILSAPTVDLDAAPAAAPLPFDHEALCISVQSDAPLERAPPGGGAGAAEEAPAAEAEAAVSQSPLSMGRRMGSGGFQSLTAGPAAPPSDGSGGQPSSLPTPTGGGVDVSSSALAGPASSLSPSPADAGGAAPAILWQERFEGFYATHNPEKVPGVGDLLARNPDEADRAKLWAMLLDKYGVTEETWRGLPSTYDDEY